MLQAINSEYLCSNTLCPKDNEGNTITSIKYDTEDSQFKFPFRTFATFEYDLQKQLKFVAAMTGIAGSTKIGNNVLAGGQVGIAGHLSLIHI